MDKFLSICILSIVQKWNATFLILEISYQFKSTQ